MSIVNYKLADIGEGLTEAELVSWHVRPGDAITQGSLICEVETDKSVVELPSPYKGKVVRLNVVEGDMVPIGTVLCEIDVTE